MTSTRIHRHRLFGVVVTMALLMLSAIDAGAGQPPGFVYALNVRSGANNRVYGFRLSVVSGGMTPLPGSPWISSGQTGSSLNATEMMAYGNGRLFVINDGTNTLTVFNVNRVTGALTEETYSPIALGVGDWVCVAVHPSGSPVVVGNASFSPTVASFVVTGTGATPAAGSPFALTEGGYPFSCAFSRDGNYVYTGGNSEVSLIAGFAVAPATGILTALPGSPFDSGGGFPGAYATDSSGRLFVGNLVYGELRVFTTSGGVPTSVSGNPFPSGPGNTVRGLVHPAGFYIGASPGTGVSVHQIAGNGSGTTLSPVSGSPFSSGGIQPTTLALSLDGRVLVAGHAASRSLSSFFVNPTTGALTPSSIQNANTLGSSGIISGLAFAPGPTPGDFDGDAKAEIAVYLPSTGEWLSLLSGTNYTTANQTSWGNSTDRIVPADYDGDGLTDWAVYRPSNGTWYVLKSSGGGFIFGWFAIQWGISTDLPVPGDYDGDGRADLGLYRPSTGLWIILTSTSNYQTAIVELWGISTDVPVQADYDGDRKTDIAVFRPSNGTWRILKSNANYTTDDLYYWGGAGDVTAPGDYDGDGRTDLAFFRPSTGVWWVRKSDNNYANHFTVNWGVAADVVVAGDYDGDGHADIAVFRPSTGVWWILTSSSSYTTFLNFTWGSSTAIPILGRQ